MKKLNKVISNYEYAHYIADSYNFIGNHDSRAVESVNELLENVQAFEDIYKTELTQKNKASQYVLDLMYQDSVSIYKQALDVESNVESNVEYLF